jgi:hypothetical protein
MVGPHVKLPAGSYVTLAGTEPANSTPNAVMVELNVNGYGF